MAHKIVTKKIMFSLSLVKVASLTVIKRFMQYINLLCNEVIKIILIAYYLQLLDLN